MSTQTEQLPNDFQQEVHNNLIAADATIAGPQKRKPGRPVGSGKHPYKGPILSAHLMAVLEANNGIALRQLVTMTIADAIAKDGPSRQLVFERIEGKVPNSLFINAGDVEEDRTAIVATATALLDSLKPVDNK